VADENGKSGNLSADSQPGPGKALTEAAARVLENLAELEPELVNAGIFDGDRAVAVSSGSATWEKEAVGLLNALEAGSGEEKMDSAHVAALDGEVFVVSESGLSLVAVTGRFVLASLTAYDIRMALRDAARARGGAKAGKAGSRAEKAEDDNA
jgi:hypothetical protein